MYSTNSAFALCGPPSCQNFRVIRILLELRVELFVYGHQPKTKELLVVLVVVIVVHLLVQFLI